MTVGTRQSSAFHPGVGAFCSMAAGLLHALGLGIACKIHYVFMFVLKKLPLNLIKGPMAHWEAFLNFCVL